MWTVSPLRESSLGLSFKPPFSIMATEDPQLSVGLCARLTDYAGPPDDPVLTETHTLQVLTVKSVGSAGHGANDRFRMILSDGVSILQAMLATQLNYLLHEERIQKNTVIRINRMSANMVQGKTYAYETRLLSHLRYSC